MEGAESVISPPQSPLKLLPGLSLSSSRCNPSCLAQVDPSEKSQQTLSCLAFLAVCVMRCEGHLCTPNPTTFPHQQISPSPDPLLGASSINPLASVTDGPENKDIILPMIAPPPQGSFRLLFWLLCLNLSIRDSASVLHLAPFEISSRPV